MYINRRLAKHVVYLHKGILYSNNEDLTQHMQIPEMLCWAKEAGHEVVQSIWFRLDEMTEQAKLIFWVKVKLAK